MKESHLPGSLISHETDGFSQRDLKKIAVWERLSLSSELFHGKWACDGVTKNSCWKLTITTVFSDFSESKGSGFLAYSVVLFDFFCAFFFFRGCFQFCFSLGTSVM